MKKKFIINTLMVLMLLTPSVIASTDFAQKIDGLLEQHKLPGVTVLIKQGDKTVYYAAHGQVNRDHAKPLEKDAIFRIFSMSKPITAFALLQLVDQGKISLNDDIRKHLPAFDPFEFDGKQHVVTVHQLLTHTAGFGYGGGFKNWVNFRYFVSKPLSKRNTLDDLVDDISGIGLKYSPGSEWQYSIASDIQGALIKKVSGMRLDTYLNRNIFEPLKMKDTGFFVPQREKHRLVDMYEYEAKTYEEAHQFNSDKITFLEKAKKSKYLKQPKLLSGGGGLVSTASDYSSFVTMLLNKGRFDGKTLLSESLVEKMLSSHTQGLNMSFLPRVYPDTGFGYGIGVKESEKGLRGKGSFFWAGMGGTVFWADPSNDLLVVAMMQVEDGWIALEKWLLPQVYQLIEPQKDE